VLEREFILVFELAALDRRDRSLTTEYETLGKPQMKHLSNIRSSY